MRRKVVYCILTSIFFGFLMFIILKPVIPLSDRLVAIGITMIVGLLIGIRAFFLTKEELTN